jgi:NADH-quinone oxidoreductase subunit L
MLNACILLAIGLPWLGDVAVWLVSDGKPRLQHTLAVGFSVAAGLAALGMLPGVTSTATLRFPLGGLFGDISFVADGLGIFLAVVATVVGSLAVIFSVDYMQGDPQLGRYYALSSSSSGPWLGWCSPTACSSSSSSGKSPLSAPMP